MKYALILTVFAVLITPSFAGKQILLNPAFEDGIADWKFIAHGNEYRGKVTDPVVKKGKDGKPEVELDVPHASSSHYFRLDQVVNLTEGETYDISFELRADDTTPKMNVNIAMQKFPHTRHGLSVSDSLSTDWHRWEVRFKAVKIDFENPPTLRFNFGNLKGKVGIRNCSLRKSDGEAVSKQVVKKMKPEDASAPVPNASGASDVTVASLLEAFSKNGMKAQNDYKGKLLAVSGYVTGVKKATRPGLYSLDMNYGGVTLQVGGKEFGTEQFDELTENLKDVRDALKDREKEEKKDKKAEKLKSSERKARDLKSYPFIECEGKFFGYRSREVIISPTRNLDITPGAVR